MIILEMTAGHMWKKNEGDRRGRPGAADEL